MEDNVKSKGNNLTAKSTWLQNSYTEATGNSYHAQGPQGGSSGKGACGANRTISPEAEYQLYKSRPLLYTQFSTCVPSHTIHTIITLLLITYNI